MTTAATETPNTPAAATPVLAMLTPEQKLTRLEDKLLKTIELERRAATRVKRATTLLHKYQQQRRRIEKRIGAEEVRRITARLTGK